MSVRFSSEVGLTGQCEIDVHGLSKRWRYAKLVFFVWVNFLRNVLLKTLRRKAIYSLLALCGVVSPLLVAGQDDGLPLALFVAVQQNPIVGAKIESVKALGFRIDEARTGQMPTLSVIGQSNANNSNHGLFRMQQPLWAFGRIDGAIELAGKQHISGQASLLLTRRQLIEDTAVAYVGLFGGRQRLRIAEQNVKEHEKLLALINRRMSGGIASEADMLMARSRLAQAQATREQIAGQVAKAKIDLSALTLRDVPAMLPVPTELSFLPPDTELQTIARANEAGVLQKMAELAVAEMAARQRRLELMPTVSFRHERDISPNLPLGSNLKVVRNGIYFESTLEGAGLTGWTRLKGEDARINAAQQDLEMARNDAARKVSGHLANLQSLRAVRVSQTTTTQAAEASLASFLRQYDAGRKTWIDVLNSQKELADNQLSLEQTLISEIELTLRLSTIVGALDAVAQIQP